MPMRLMGVILTLVFGSGSSEKQKNTSNKRKKHQSVFFNLVDVT